MQAVPLMLINSAKSTLVDRSIFIKNRYREAGNSSGFQELGNGILQACGNYTAAINTGDGTIGQKCGRSKKDHYQLKAKQVHNGGKMAQDAKFKKVACGMTFVEEKAKGR